MIGVAAGADDVGVLDFNFQEDIQGVTLTQETWYMGECIESKLLSYGGADGMDSLYISTGWLEDESKNKIGTEWNMLSKFTEGYSHIPVKVIFPEDQNKEIFGWSAAFLGQSTDKEILLNAGENYILARQAFDLTKKGTPGFLCESLMEKPERIKKYDCLVLLRMNTYATEEEAEAVGENEDEAICTSAESLFSKLLSD